MQENCFHCNKPLIIGGNWQLSTAKQNKHICWPCLKQAQKQRDELNPELAENRKLRHNLQSRLQNYSIKSDIINNYGGKCSCCHNNIWQFLNIDHIDGRNHLPKNLQNKTGIELYKWLLKNNCPKDEYQLLCQNCNSTKGHSGFCPHQLGLYENKCHFCNNLLNMDNTFNCYFEKLNMCKSCCVSISFRKPESKTKTFNQKIRAKELFLIDKYKVLEAYGNKCKCCEENNSLFLTIDHINNNGAIERKTIGSSRNLYKHIIKSNFPQDNYQLLCYNCNCCKGAYGKCYHQLIKEMDVPSISIEEYKVIIWNNSNIIKTGEITI